MNYSNSQRVGVILHLTALLFGAYDKPTSGNIIVDGNNLSDLNDNQRTIFRRQKIGFVFQNYNLVPILNAYENIILPVNLNGDRVDKAYYKKISEMLNLNGLEEKMPNQLSGGQQQRVAIARALITKPSIILADEPTGNLDSKSSSEVLKLIRLTSTDLKQTVIMITHNNDIAKLANRIIQIEDGKIVEDM